MKKSLYHLEAGDAFISERGNNAYTISFVDSVRNSGYKVIFEFFINKSSNLIAISTYTSPKMKRIYYPADWFAHTGLFKGTHALNAEDEQNFIKQIFKAEEIIQHGMP